MKKIANLTPEQEAELPAFRQRYLDIACGGGRINRDVLQGHLNAAYAVIGKPAPALFIFDSPAACMLALKIFKMPEASRLGIQIESHLWNQLWIQLQNQLWSQLESQIQSQLLSQLWSQLQNQLRSQLRIQIGIQIERQLGSQLQSQLAIQIESQLGSQLQSQLAIQIESQLWSQLGIQIESQLWSQLQNQLRSQLRSQLWSQLGIQLQNQLGIQNIYDSNYLWGSQDLYWLAFYRFCQSIGVKYPINLSAELDIMEGISTQCEWWFPYDSIVIASERPRLVRWDDEMRLHCENGPAVEYADGYALYSWHGQRIPEGWLSGSPPTAHEALHWPDMDARAAACEIVGWHNILEQLDAKTVEDSGDPVWGKLVEVNIPDSGKERFLDAMCGTGRRFALPVPPTTRTVDEAQSVLHGGLPASILRNYEVRT